LIVEDDQPVREALGYALASENYEIVSAGNGREALQGFAENQIDFALLDLNVGTENGWDIFERLTSLQPRLPIIVMSAFPELLSAPMAAGAVTCLEKPLNLAVLFQKMDTLSKA